MNAYVKAGLAAGGIYLVYRYYQTMKAAQSAVGNQDARALNFVGGIVRPPPVVKTSSPIGRMLGQSEEAPPSREGDEPRQVAFDGGFFSV